MLFTTIFCCSCNKQKAVILFNYEPITQENISNYTKGFEVEAKIYYILLNPKPLKYPYLRIQVLKKDEKVYKYGYSLVYSIDVKADTDKKYYTDYFTLPKKGIYVLSVFYLNDTVNAIARNDFVVK